MRRVIILTFTVALLIPVSASADLDPRCADHPEHPACQPVVADQCVLDQIAREPFKQDGDPKTKFTIINFAPDEGGLWNAPYLVDLGNGFGWISGDRAGYSAAYMFLVDIEGEGKGRVHARVLFSRVHNPEDRDIQYMAVNDKFMAEIQQTLLGYDGTCADGTEDDPLSQAQAPDGDTEYAIDNSPEVRPLVPIRVNGVVVENRSYTNTVKLSENFVFDDGGRITRRFLDYNGVGGSEHWVFQRQIVLVKKGVTGTGDLSIIGFVYYDSLDRATTIGG